MTIISLKGHAKNTPKCERSYPIQYFSEPENKDKLKDVNVYELIRPFDSMLEQIFSINLKKEIYDVDMGEGYCNVILNPQYQSKQIKFEQLYDFLMYNGKPKANQCVAEEFIDDIYYRMFFDIEPKKRQKGEKEDKQATVEIIPIEEIK